MVFRDEWVPFEPGGESLWAGTQRSDGLWHVERIRYMDYETSDEAHPPPHVAPRLPEEFEEPAPGALEAVCAEVSTTCGEPRESRLIDYVATALGGLAAATTGRMLFALAVAVVPLAGRAMFSILRRRSKARARARRLHPVLNRQRS